MKNWTEERKSYASVIARLQRQVDERDHQNSTLTEAARRDESRLKESPPSSPREKKLRSFKDIDHETIMNSGSDNKAHMLVKRRAERMEDVLEEAKKDGKFNVVGDVDGDGRDGLSEAKVEDFLTSYIIANAGTEWVANAFTAVLGRALEMRGRGRRDDEFALQPIAELDAALDGRCAMDSPYTKIVDHVAKGVVGKIDEAWDGPHTVLIQKTLGLSRLKLDQLRRLLSFAFVAGDCDEANAEAPARKWMPREVVKGVSYPKLASRSDVQNATKEICEKLNIHAGASAESAVIDIRSLVKDIMANLVASGRADSGADIQFILEGDAFRVFRGVAATNVGVRIRVNDAPFPGSSREWYPILLTEGADKYEVLQESLRPLMDELRTMLGNPLRVETNDSENVYDFMVNRVLLVGGDMPFLHEVLAQRGATHTYGCIYCTAPSQRHLALVRDAIDNRKTQLPDDIKLRSVNDLFKWAHLPYMRDDGSPEPMLCDACIPPKQFSALHDFQISPDPPLSSQDVKTHRDSHMAVFPGRRPLVPLIHTSSEDAAPFLVLDHVLGDPLHLITNEFNRMFHNTIRQQIADEDAAQKWSSIIGSLGTALKARISEQRTKGKELPLIQFIGNEVDKVLDNLLGKSSVPFDECLLSLVKDELKRKNIEELFEAFDKLKRTLLRDGSVATDANAHADEVEKLCLDYAKLYLAYASSNCAPYLHYLAHHLPDQVRRHGPNYAQYSQQASESSHKDIKGEFACPLCLSAVCQALNTPSPFLNLQRT